MAYYYYYIVLDRNYNHNIINVCMYKLDRQRFKNSQVLSVANKYPPF